VLVDSLRAKQKRDAVNMSLSSAFCWVPRGQGQGDPCAPAAAARAHVLRRGLVW
jgi:hypothetical protein